MLAWLCVHVGVWWMAYVAPSVFIGAFDILGPLHELALLVQVLQDEEEELSGVLLPPCTHTTHSTPTTIRHPPTHRYIHVSVVWRTVFWLGDELEPLVEDHARHVLGVEGVAVGLASGRHASAAPRSCIAHITYTHTHDIAHCACVCV